MALFLGSIGAVTGYVVLSHAAPLEKFTEVKVGMGEKEVRAILGAPDDTETTPSKTTYYYGEGLRHLQWCTMNVVFGPDGRVVATRHDH